MRVIDNIHSDQIEVGDIIRHPDGGAYVTVEEIEDIGDGIMSFQVKDDLDMDDFIHTEYNDVWEIFLDDGED